MSDIVERLRAIRDWWRAPGRMAEQAADEIEKLRATLNLAVTSHHEAVNTAISLVAERDTLRAALRKLYDHEGERVLNSIGIECYTEELEDALCEARAALGEKE